MIMRFKDRAVDDQILNMLLRVSIICCTGIAVAIIYEKPDIASLLFHASFFINLISFSICIQQKMLTRNMRFIVRVFLLILAFGILSIMRIDITFDYIKKFIIYITVLSSYFVAATVRTSKRTVITLLGCNLLLAILYIDRSQAYGAYVGSTLSMHFSNPNFTGMWLSMTAMLLVITIIFLKSKILKALVIVVTGYIMYLCYETGARNVILSLAYVVSLLLYCIFSKKKQFSQPMVIFLNLFPLIFAVIYILVIKYVGFSDWILKRITSSGKLIDSRYDIWLEAFSYMKSHILLGAYKYADGGSGMFQLHNTHLDTWASYGLIGFSLFCVYIHKIIQVINMKSRSLKPMLTLAAFIVMLLIGTGEAGLYATGMGMYIYVASFLMLSSYFAENGEAGADEEEIQ